MTANHSIFQNFIAAYGCSLYALALGLLRGRGPLMAFGEVDYGLMGLVGGLTAFVSFFNSLMLMAAGRFYGYVMDMPIGTPHGLVKNGLYQFGPLKGLDLFTAARNAFQEKTSR